MFVLIAFTIFRVNKKINKATEQAGIVSSIGKNLNDLNMVTYEFLLYHEERMQQQWYVAYASISKLLKERNEKPDSPEEAAILQSISRDIKAIHALFLKLIAIHDKRNMLSSGNEHEDKLPSPGPLDTILAAELLVKSHHATFGGLRLHALAQKEMIETQRKADSVIIISMIIFMVVLLISGALTIRSIATPISKLVKGTHVIGKGNFDYTFKVKARDEIGELAASFNTMAQNLLARERALRESEAKYRSLTNDVLDSSEVGIFILDSDFNVVWMNHSLERYFGLRRDVIIGKDKRQLLRKRIKDIFDDPESIVQKVFATYDNNTYIENFECHVLPDGERRERWLEHWSQPIWSGLYTGGRIEHYYDITKRKQAENHIQHLQSVLKAIRNINQLIVHEKNRKKLLQRACDILNRASEYKLIWIGLIEEDTKDVLPIAQAGFEEGYLTSLRITWDDSETGNGPTGTAIKTKKPSIIRDLSTDPRYKPWREKAIERGYVSSVAVPLVYEERIFGALNVYATNPEVFDEEEMDLLLEIGQDIAFALNNIEKEEEIERTKEFLQNIIDNTSDLVCTVDLEGNFLSINKAVTDQLGYEEADLIGTPKIDLAVEPELFISTFEEVLEKGSLSNFEVQFKRKDGAIADILYSVALLRDKNGNPVAVAGFGKDITEHKRAVEELQERRDEITKFAVIAKERGELQDWINTFDTFVAKFDPNGIGIIFNEAPLKAGGVTIADVVGEYFPDAKWWSHSRIEREKIVECFKRAKAGLSSRIETTFRRDDGTPVPIIFNSQPVMDDGGKVKYVTAEGKTIIEEAKLRTELQEAKDALEIRVRERTAELVEAIDKLKKEIGERKRAEEELEKYREQLEELVKERTRDLEEKTRDLQQANIRLQELDHLKSMFIASMSHELRTPLNSIIGFTGIILQGMVGEITAEQRKQLTMVKNSGTHLLALINDVIDVSKIEAGKVELAIEEFDLPALVNEVRDAFNIAANEKRLKMSLEMPERFLIRNDRRRTKQILMNLLSNAVKFTDRGEIEMRLEQNSGGVEVSVRDTGIGIRKEDMGKLFKAFSQIYIEGRPKQEGTGLGIYLSKKIANLLGGEIKANSEFGTGSEFTFTLPLKCKEPNT
jgi:PAS domain S-box-containing protein